jgi:hypothetical protein
VQVSGVGELHEADPRVAETWRLSALPLGGVVLHGYARYDGVLKAVAQRHGFPFSPTGAPRLEAMRGYAGHDPVQFNDRSADRMVHQVAKALLSARVLSRWPGAGAPR